MPWESIPRSCVGDLPGLTSKDTQFLSVDGVDGDFSGAQPYSPQSSTDENYIGFGLSKRQQEGIAGGDCNIQ